MLGLAVTLALGLRLKLGVVLTLTLGLTLGLTLALTLALELGLNVGVALGTELVDAVGEETILEEGLTVIVGVALIVGARLTSGEEAGAQIQPSSLRCGENSHRCNSHPCTAALSALQSCHAGLRAL